MEIFLTRQFQRRFEGLPKELKPRIEEAITEIKQTPWEGKKLTGNLLGHYSWRVGRYRILYTIQGNNIFAETVRHRKESYR